mgnify:FL=1
MGINDSKTETINAYPNPFDNVISLHLTSPQDVLLYNALGEVVFEAKHQQQKISINTASLAPGLYFLVTDDHQLLKSVKKMIK